jgi:alkylation response protein AidB-like acyl-CoA dehydrogenase
MTGGAWLFEDVAPGDTLTPERLSDEHRLIAQTTNSFVEAEVLPAMARLEQKDWALARTLLRRCGDLGLLAVAVPEALGGLELDKASSLVVAECMGRAASFSTTFGGQANLTILPLVMFGTPEQQTQYLPRLMTGELVGAYALSESGSGSDALAARTRADRQPDGSWRLNGEKMWISNGGFADLIVVFAKVDGEHLTAFLVERAFPGVSSGPEEHKMGLHGSSTTPILLQDAEVPAGNVLGAIGAGHKVALNTLNYGRFSLGASCAGAARAAIAEAARYAAARRQFGQPIARFGAIRHKLGEMVARTYALESLNHRTAGLIDARLESSGRAGTAIAGAFEAYAVEASIAKVAGSETLDFVLDENVQIHGGNGFVRDYAAERHYRDARVNRIFEGTNEINRLLIPGMLVRRALKGELPLLEAAGRLEEDLRQAPATAAGDADTEILAPEARTAVALKQVAVMVLGLAVRTHGDRLAEEQEVLSWTADVLIEAYAAESAVLRARAATQGDARPETADLHVTAARLAVAGSDRRAREAASDALAALTGGEALQTAHAALARIRTIVPVNTMALRRALADAATAGGQYPFEW